MSDSYFLTPVILLFSFPALGGFLFGYDIGATSFVVKQIIDETHSGVKWAHELDSNTQLQGAVTAGSVFGALIASIIVFKLSTSIGRKKELQIGALLYIIGAVIEGNMYHYNI